MIDRLFPSTDDFFPCRNDPDYHGNVRYYLERAQKVHAISPTDDEAMLEHILEILAEIGPAKVMCATIWNAFRRSVPVSKKDDEAMIEHILEILAEIGPAKVQQR